MPITKFVLNETSYFGENARSVLPEEIQKRGFKNVEVSLQSQQIRDLTDKLREIGAYGVGMSSFGPTVYSVFDKNNKHIVEEIKEYVGNRGIVLTTKAQNYGHEIQK